ncbi:MAG TPA: LysM peptidoglycan-binding domain-containing protein [Microbacteriaceae bacterium]|nr:LysM peptidoglycan-binding domain-containing protein [Microbacteriaceae bacterium]
MAKHGLRGRHSGAPIRRIVPAAPEPETPEFIEHTVVDGETFSSIARNYGVPTAKLLAMNGLSWSSGLASGQRLLVPNRLGIAPSMSDTDVIRYRIEAGETISAIAARHGVTRQAILSANGLHPTSLIFIGQVIRIPEVSVDTRATPAVVTTERHFG